MQIEDQTKQHTQHSHIDTCDTIHEEEEKMGRRKEKANDRTKNA